MNRRALRSPFAAFVPSLPTTVASLAALVRCVFAFLFALCSHHAAHAQPGPDYDFQWATVGSPGNAAYQSPFPPAEPSVHNRGNVPYEYRISRLEVTTAQWMEFSNAFAEVPGNPLANTIPGHWGATIDRVIPSTGRRVYRLTDLPHAARLPVAGLGWHDAARYCNWLHNNKEVSLAAINTGAYDTSTWSPDGSTDAATHLAGARFWIPTLDEFIKATHFDPNKFGPGQPGYWRYKNSSDSPAITGLPGVGTTSAGYRTPDDVFAGWNIPLGSYTDSQSPWGLWDTSGGSHEWTEEKTVNERIYAGSHVFDTPFSAELRDQIGRVGSSAPTGVGSISVHIASSVPSAGVCGLLLIGASVLAKRNR